MLRFEPLFGGTSYITDAQKTACEIAATVLKPRADVVCSMDERGDGILEALFNTDPPPYAFSGEIYKLTVLPDGSVQRFEQDRSADIEDFDWEDATRLPQWADLISAGLREVQGGSDA